MAAASAAAAAPLDEANAKSVLGQVEFYFSNSNLPRDKFLRETVEHSDDGLVILAFTCSFSRMKSHLGLDEAVKPEAVLENTVLVVAEVLRCSPVLLVSEDVISDFISPYSQQHYPGAYINGKRIGRASELLNPDVIIEQVDSRTVAA